MDELLEFIKKCELFSGLTDFEMRELAPFFQEKKYGKGDWIVQEGEEGQVLYLIRTGGAEIVKKEAHYGEYQNLGRLQAGDWFGEMAFLEEGTRSASARALDNTDIYTLSLEDLKKLDNQKAFVQIVSTLAKGVSRRLRTADESLVESLKEKLRTTLLQEEMARLIIQILIFFAIYVNFVKISSTYSSSSLFVQIISPITILVLIALGVYLLYRTKFPPAFFGLTLHNWKKNALEGVLWTIPMLAIILAMKWMLIQYVPEFESLPLFDFFPGLETKEQIIFFSGLYLVLIPIQELIARGVLQSFLQEFFQGRNKILNAILTSNILFGAAHAAKTASLSAMTFFIGIVWGFLYARQRSLVGVIISHILFGIWGFFILGYERIFIY